MSLYLDSLHVAGFRAFQDLAIPRLGRVNLITGKNNVGKTCLLEALLLYARQGSPRAIVDILADRREITPNSYGRRLPADEEDPTQALAVRYLFAGRPPLVGPVAPIEISPLGGKPALRIAVGGYGGRADESGTLYLEGMEDRLLREAAPPSISMAVAYAGRETRIDDLARYFARRAMPATGGEDRACVLVPPGGLDDTRVAQYWDQVALTDLESQVVRALRLIGPEVERVTLVGDPLYARYRRPIAKVAGVGEPVPLRSLGEGMNRLFGLALALANAAKGFLLIDEIESGLHYSTFVDLWTLVLEMAQRLDVQVFATTHSWDCIKGFQLAVQDDSHDGLLIRLANREGQIVPTIFDREMLRVATSEQIEIR